MNRRNTLIICIVVVLAVVAGVIALRGSRTSTFKQDYHVEDISSVTKVYISDKESNNVLLEKETADDKWIVDGKYEASQPIVDLMLQTLHDMRIRQQVNKNAAPNIIKRLAASSIKVEVYQNVYFINWFNGKVKLFPHEKLTVTYFVGFETQDQMGTHMYRKGDKDPYIIHIPGFRGFLAPRFPTNTLAWRSHRIVALDVKHLARVELQIPASPDEGFAIYREGDDFKLELAANHQTVSHFDTARVAQMLSSFTNLNFDEYARAVPHADPAQSVSQTPRAILRITDTDGNTSEVKTYIKYDNPDDSKAMPDKELYNTFDVNRLYAIVNNTDTVLIQYYVFDNILQPASFFLGESPSTFAR